MSAGKNFEKVCEMCHITVNKTPIFGDNGSISPAGVRIGKVVNVYVLVVVMNYLFFTCILQVPQP